MSTSSSHIKCWYMMVLLNLLTITAWAQGNSIPTSSAVQQERETSLDELEILPEGVKYRYPLLNGMSVSYNIFPTVLNIFGKDYGIYEGAITLDLHHRFFPQASAGLGYCNQESKDFVKYHCPMLPFFKVGMLYNFNYNNRKSDDFYGALVRFGYAYSKADVSNLYYANGFWEDSGPFNIEGMEFNSVWMELGGFIKVKVMKHLSMGWDLTYKPFLHRGNDRQGKPYFVPGYGTTNTSFGLGFHIYYDLW